MSRQLATEKSGHAGLLIILSIAVAVQLGALLLVCFHPNVPLSNHNRQISAAAGHTAALGVEIQKFNATLTAASTSVRDFLLTGHDAALAQYRKASEAALHSLGRMESLCSQNPQELARIHRIATLNDRAFDQISALRQFAPEKASARFPVAALDSAQSAVDNLLAETAALQAADDHWLAGALSSEAHNLESGQQDVVRYALVFGLAAAALSVFLIFNAVRRRETALRLAYAQAIAQHETAQPAPAPAPVAAPAAAPPPVSQATSLISTDAGALRSAVESAVVHVTDYASKRLITFRATLGSSWDIPVHADLNVLTQTVVTILNAIIDSDHPSGPVTLSCSETPDHRIRLQFQSAGSLTGSQLPSTVHTALRVLSARIIPGCGSGVVVLEFQTSAALAPHATLATSNA